MSDSVDDATTVDDATRRARYWPIPVLRAVPAAIVALVITFSSNHAAGYGLVLFGAYAVVEAIVLVLGSRRLDGDRRSRRSSRAQALVAGVTGLAALALSGGGLPAFITIVVAFAVLTGALELTQGLRARGRSPFARDWSTVGGLTLLLAIAFLVTPPDYSKQLGGIDDAQGTLDAPIILVGLLGAYLAVTAVFHVIAGLSHKWGTAAPGAAPNGAPHA